MKIRSVVVGLLGTVVLFGISQSRSAVAATYTLVSGDVDLLYQYPGADGLMGTGDDQLGTGVTSFNGSSPNTSAAYSMALPSVPLGPGDPALPPGVNLISFVSGAITTDDSIAMNGGTSLVTAVDVTMTDLYQGIGSPTITVSAINGTYNAATRSLTGTMNLDLSFLGGLIVWNETVSVSGVAYPQTNLNATGNNYVDTTVIPAANALGATGLLFIDIAGTFGPNLPFAIVATPVRLVMVGVSGVSAGGQADLSITKSVNVSNTQMPGDNVVYTLSASNAGSANSNTVTVTDKLPPGSIFVGDSCGAGPPQNGLLTWGLSLNSGSNANCTVSLNIGNATNFDISNAAIIYGENLDPDPSNNIAEEPVEVLDGGGEGLDQNVRPSGFVAPSDIECDNCSGVSQALVDNFKVDDLIQIDQLRFCGGYTNNVPFNDSFRIEIYDDREFTPGIEGVPGELVATLPSNPIRTNTGVIYQNRTLYEYTINLGPTPPRLPRGRYWLLAINNSGVVGGTGDWFWAQANADSFGRTLPGIAFNPAFAEGVPEWGPNPAAEFCFDMQITDLESEIFLDGFESGNTSAWSSVATVTTVSIGLIVGLFGWRRHRS